MRPQITTRQHRRKDGFTVVTVAAVSKDGKQKPHQKLAVSRRGLLWLENPSRFDEPVWLLKSPVRAGEKWEFRTSGSGVVEGKGTMRVVGTETIEVPAGKFTAVRVEEQFTALADGKPIDHTRSIHWYAPGIGLVKSNFEGIETVLKSFTPGK